MVKNKIFFEYARPEYLTKQTKCEHFDISYNCSKLPIIIDTEDHITKLDYEAFLELRTKLNDLYNELN